MLEVAAVLKEEAALLSVFIALLTDEQKQLVAGEIDNLATLADKKKDLAEKLAHLKSRRLSMVSDIAYSEEVKRDLATLQAMAQQALNLNNLNGKLINDRLSSNQATLQVLMDAVKRATVYGPDGQTKMVGKGRALGQA